MKARLAARLAGGAVLGAAVLAVAVPAPAMAAPKVVKVSPSVVRPGQSVFVRVWCAKGVKTGEVSLTGPTSAVASSRLKYRKNGSLTASLWVPRTMPRGKYQVVAMCDNEGSTKVANVYVTKRGKRPSGGASTGGGSTAGGGNDAALRAGAGMLAVGGLLGGTTVWRRRSGARS
jgi:hypothetical protein